MAINKKLLLILASTVAVVLLALMVLFVVSKSKKQAPAQKQPVSLATPTPKYDTQTLSTQAIEKKQALTKTAKVSGDLQLAQNDNFEIDYLISNDDFIVIINKNPYPETKKLAEQFFTDKGFTKEELCTLKIRFYPAKEVTVGYTGGPQDSVPTGCKPTNSL